MNDFAFVPLAEGHLPMLREWLLRPHVARWWGEAETLAELRASYVARAFVRRISTTRP